VNLNRLAVITGVQSLSSKDNSVGFQVGSHDFVLRRPIYFLSITHTGTRFFLEIIRRVTGITKDHKLKQLQEPRPLQRYDLAASHIFTENLPVIHDYIAKYDPLIFMTNRDAEATRRSWVSRGKDVGDLMLYQEYADELQRAYAPIMLSIDDPNKEKMFDVFGAALYGNLKLKTDWKRIGSVHDGDRIGFQHRTGRRR